MILAVWTAAVVPFLAAILILLVPGLVVAIIGGFRGLGAAALAPLIGIGVLSVSALVAPFLGIRWGILAAVLGTALTALATLILRMMLARRFDCKISAISTGFGVTPAAVIGLAVGGSVILYRLLQIFGSPDFVSQTADNVFHLNAVRYIIDTGNASSLSLGAAGGSSPSFYPGAWHGLAALIAVVSGFSISASVASLNLVIGAVVWPLSMWYLCRTLFGGSTIMNIGFSVLVSAFSAFPYLLIDWGVLYPNYLGMAVLPAATALVLTIVRNGLPVKPHSVMFAWVALVGLAGASLAHPNTIICLIATLVPFLLGRILRPSVIRAVREGSIQRPGLKIALTLLLSLVLAALWLVLRPFPITSYQITWQPYQSTAQAVGEAFLAAHSAKGASWASGVLLVMGLVAAIKHRSHRWLLVAFAGWTLLFVAVTGWAPSMLRAFLTGGWFDDYKRIAAGLVMVVMPLSLLGFIVVARRLDRAFAKFNLRRSTVWTLSAALLVAVPTLYVSQTGPIRDAAISAKTNYSLRPGSPIMSLDEFKLYSELPELVPADSVIAGNPWDGSAWAYFVSGRHVLYPHVLAAMNDDKELIAKSFRDASVNPAVCAAAERLHVGYAINSDELIYLPGNPNNQAYPGLAHLEQAPGFQLVAQVGSNRLYKLTAC